MKLLIQTFRLVTFKPQTFNSIISTKFYSTKQIRPSLFKSLNQSETIKQKLTAQRNAASFTTPTNNVIKEQQNQTKQKDVNNNTNNNKGQKLSLSPKRLIKKKTILNKKDRNELQVISYSTADYYDLNQIKQSVLDGAGYDLIEIAEDAEKSCLCLKAKYDTITKTSDEPRVVYIFEEGSCVFWNMNDEVEQKIILNQINRFAERVYDTDLINDECEVLSYSIEDNNTTRLYKSHIYFTSKSDETDLYLEKYAFSDAISTSVKLAILERKLENFIESIEHVSEDLKYGRMYKLTSEQVLQKTGYLLTMRHQINLRFDLLDTPDWYWDRDRLEKLYLSAINFLDISKRTRVFNEKLNHCIDLMKIIEADLNERKHTRLEWFIITLIAIEVVFGIVSFINNHSH